MISIRRLRALVWKEMLQVSRDPSSILIAFALPVLLLFIFGYGVSLDSRNVPIGLVIEQPGSATESFAAALDASPYIELHQAAHMAELEPELVATHLRGIVVLQDDFEKKLLNPQATAPIQVITDGSNPQIAAFVENYIRGAWSHWLDLRRVEQGLPTITPVQLDMRFWYNPDVNSRYFLIPGSIAIILTVVGALLTALVIAREWERGTMEAILASPINRLELLLGKVIPYFALGQLSFTLCLLVATLLFGVPLRGSLWLLYGITSLFLFGALGLGLTISAITKNQFLASQAAINAAFLPAFILSGFIFEIRSMPVWIQKITYIFPARYLVNSLQTLFLAGDVWEVLIPDIIALSIIALFFMVAISINLKRHLD